MILIIARDLAVVKGLLFSRSIVLFQHSSAQAPPALLRVSRLSYGIVYNQLFNPHLHRDQEIFRDESDGRVYARNQIKWVLKVR